jgi:ElaB/YqjD/DUF883 family membrane-anchored ribosome-binding protein
VICSVRQMTQTSCQNTSTDADVRLLSVDSFGCCPLTCGYPLFPDKRGTFITAHDYTRRSTHKGVSQVRALRISMRRSPPEGNVTSTSGPSSSAGSGAPDFATAKSTASEALNRGKEGLSNAASNLASDASADLDSLRRDLNNLKDTVSRFMSQAGQVSSSVASGLAESGADMASMAKGQARTFASELENMVRRNPLGAMAAAVMVGVLIGLIGRGRNDG